MQISESLIDEHKALAKHFSDLAESRSQLPVFAIEHGLDTEALAKLKTTVALVLETDPQLQGVMWNWTYLPLLVMATEVGYRYRGTGTDFWPVLSQELGIEAGFRFRAGISRIFELGHQSFRLAQPGDSGWERHFPHIAWPIGNAVVPLEIQPQLSEALRRAVRTGISVDNTEALYEHLKVLAAGHTSRRFENWLHRSDVALEVMRRLLAPDSDGWLSQGILSRIDDDIRGDLGASRAINEARRISARRSARLAEVPRSLFALDLIDGVVEKLLIRGPALPSNLRDEVTAALRIQGDRMRAIGSDQSILLRSFLAGGEIPMGSVGTLPEAPLRRGDTLLSTPVLADTMLERLQPLDATYFLIEPGEHAAHAVFPKEVLAPDAAVLQRLKIDDHESLEFQRLVASSAADAALLRNSGFTILERQPTLRVLGLPMSGAQSRFAADFPILVAPRHADLVPLLDGSQPAFGSLHLRGVTWAMFQPSAGEHWVAPADADDHEKLELHVIEPPDVEPASVTILPAEANMVDLADGTLEIRITAPLALEELRIRLRVSSSNQPNILVEDIVDRLPARINGRTPLMQALRSQLAEQWTEISGVRLVVEVRGLLSATISLPPIRRDLRYDPATGHWFSESEDGRTLKSLTATLLAPLPTATDNHMTGFRLVLPDAPDHEALRAGLVISGGTTVRIGQQEPARIVLPTLLREADSRDGRTGLVEIARATLAWQLAEVADPVASWHRQAVVSHLECAAVELLCGPAWGTMETGIDLSILSPHGALYRSAGTLGLISGEGLPRIESVSDLAFLRNRLVARLRETVPDIDDALARWDVELAGDLDLAVIDAYEDLRLHLQSTDREAFEEVDMSRHAKDWRMALEQARHMPLLPMFHRFILPEARWTALMSPWYDDLSEDDLVDLLDSCHVDALRRSGLRWIGRPELRTLLQFWVSPRALINAEDSLRLLAKGLSDMQTARAVRYVALRHKLAQLEMPDGSSA